MVLQKIDINLIFSTLRLIKRKLAESFC